MTRNLLLVLFCMWCTGSVLYAGGLVEDAATAAIIAAVKSRVAGTADIRVENVQARGDLMRAFIARLPPGARTGVRTRFALVSADQSGTEVGEAEATIF